MKNLRVDGHAVMTLTDMVDDFCLAQGNMRESGYLAQIRHARWSWKELYRTTTWFIRIQVLELDRNHSIKLPNDCERVINIQVVDCHGKKHPLGFNTDWNTTKISCIKTKCSCDHCSGTDTLCAAIDSLKVVLSTVTINGKDYTNTTYYKYDRCGDVQKQEVVNVWDSANNVVTQITNTYLICNVETTEHGCIKATSANMGLLRDNCGCGNFFDEWNALGYHWGNYDSYRELINAPYNYWGEFNFNAACGDIIQIFQPHCRHFGHNDHQEREWRNGIRQVILEYQTNGETPDTEILIPEYAVEAVETGMFYRQKKLNPRATANDRAMTKAEWEESKTGVAKYLNPINLEFFAKLQTNKRLW